MKRFNVEIDFNIPDNITKEEFEEWCVFTLIGWNGCKCSNPLSDKDASEFVSTYRISEW